MKVLLTGGSGFLGRHVLHCLRRHGVHTVTVGRQRPCGSDDTDWIAADLLATHNLTELAQQVRATHLLHLAWYAEHGQYWNSSLNLRWVDATVRLTEAFCHAGGQHVVVAGTCAEYDWSHGYCREEGTPLNPATLYGIAKDAARRLVMAVCEQNQVACAWGRVFLPFGAGEPAQRLLPSLIAALRGQRSPFATYATAYRDFLHASDVAAGLVALLHPAACGEYNISSGQPVQLTNLVHLLAGLVHADPRPILALSQVRTNEPSLLVGNSNRLQTLGWYPTLSLQQALHRAVVEVT